MNLLDKFVALPYFWIPEDTLDLRVRRDHVPYDIWEWQGFSAPPAPSNFNDGGIAMNFYTWMMKKHINTKAPVGDLARDMKGDREFPRDGDKAVIRDYLEGCGACSGCMDAFERAWRKYERGRWSRNWFGL